MSSIPEKLMALVNYIFPESKRGWVEAMSAELAHIEGRSSRIVFASGCLQTAIGVAARTRLGLSLIGRGLVAAALLPMSLYGVWFAGTFENIRFQQIITVSSTLYLIAAVLCLISLKVMRAYAAIGVCLSMVAWGVIKLKDFGLTDLPHETLSAIALESIALMGGLFVVASYLHLLHDPEAEA